MTPLLLLAALSSVPAGADGNEASDVPLAFRSITRGGRHTCALLDNGSVKCWGWNFVGQLGLGDIDDRGDGPTDEMGAALPAVDLSTDATALSAGGTHTCAALDDETVKCWGSNAFGELGRGDTASRGDQPNEMGRPASSPGETIDFDVDVTNTGERRLTPIEVHAPEVPACVLQTGELNVGQTITSSCQYETTDADVPQKVAYLAVSTAQGAFDLSETRRVTVEAERFRPDAQIRRSGAFAGNNVYTTSGANQTRTATVPNLGTTTFTVRIQNDGNTTEALKVKGPGSTNRYTVTYRNGATNVTNQVVAGTFTTNPLAPGATQELTLTVKAKAGTPRGNAINHLVTVSSTTTPTIKDTVKATVRRR